MGDLGAPQVLEVVGGACHLDPPHLLAPIPSRRGENSLSTQNGTVRCGPAGLSSLVHEMMLGVSDGNRTRDL